MPRVPPREGRESCSEALFSLIVCTRGRTEELDRFLLSVINQFGNIRCEIIVVDQIQTKGLAQ